MAEIRLPVDAGKVALVGELLKQGCPGDEVLDNYDFSRSAQFYRISRGTALAHRVYVSKEFLDDHTKEEIKQLLGKWRAVDTIKAAGARAVIITNGGIAVPGARLGDTP